MDNSTGINILDNKLSFQTQLKLDSLYHHNARSEYNPQLIIFIVEMSEQMLAPYGLYELRMHYSSRLIQDILKEVCTGYHRCTDCYVSLIGYGRGIKEGSNILKNAWIQDWIYNTPLDLFSIYQNNGANYSIKCAFSKATEMCKEWVKRYPAINKYNKEGNISKLGSPTPIVFHITSGYDKDLDEITKIYSIKTSDGMPLVFNILLANGREDEIFCPESYVSNVDSFQKLFEVSSFCPYSFLIKRNPFEMPNHLRLFCANPHGTDAIKDMVRCMTLHYDFMFNMWMNPYVGDVKRVGQYVFPCVIE